MLSLIEEIAEQQRLKLFQCAQRIRPNITPEDILQPMDYPELEQNPEFRHEEGVLEGMLTILSAVRSALVDASHAKKES